MDRWIQRDEAEEEDEVKQITTYIFVFRIQMWFGLKDSRWYGMSTATVTC